MEVKKEWMEWLVGDDTGISSRTIFGAITGVPANRHGDGIPADIADVGRCVRMLRKLPDLRPQLGKVIEKHNEWMPFIDCWKELEQLYDECIKFERLPEAEQELMKKKKHYTSPNDKAWTLIQQLEMASRYLKGMRMQNNHRSWRNKAPESY